MTIPAKQTVVPPPATLEDIIIRGDLSKLSDAQCTEYVVRLCERYKLDVLTQPFDWIWLNGRKVLYANRRCADQLRKIHQISISIVSQEQKDGLYEVHVKARDAVGREDEDLGVVALPDTLKGDVRANTILKGITKAKRRVTLSISGLGFLDETEVEDIPQAKRENPNINRPEDFIDKAQYDEEGNPINNIPRGNPELKRLSKKDSDILFNNLKVKMKDFKSQEALNAWGTSVNDEVETLPDLYQVQLRELYADRWHELKVKDAGEPYEVELSNPPNWQVFGSFMIAMAATARFKDWDELNRHNQARMQNEDPKNFDLMAAGIKEARAKNVHLRSRN